MAKYRITSPEGQTYEVTAPDDASHDQVMSYAKDNFGKLPKAKADPIETAINKSPTAGVLDAAAAMGSGALAGPVSGLAGIAGTLLPGPEGQGAKWTHNVQDALSYEPRTPIGKGITNAASYPFVKLSELGDFAGAKTADATGSPGAGAGVNMALQGLPLVLGRAGPIRESPATLSKRNALRDLAQQSDEGIMKAKEAGYVLPPTQANPSLLNKITEGLAGKVKTGQEASIRNQEVTNGLVRKGLGIAEDAPLNAQTLQQVRKQASESYERVRNSGTVHADPIYSETLDSIAAPFSRAAKDFPDAARTDILDAVKAAKRESFDASSAVDQIRILRGKADQAYSGKDKSLGTAYKGIANALEEQLGRHLEESGAPASVLEDFRKSRQIIAKTYTVEKHLGADGNVNANGLAADLKRKPLSGEIRTAAEFAQQFPKAAQRPERVGGVPMSPLDHAVSLASIGGAVATGQPLVALGAAAPYARPVVRNAILSGKYQGKFVNPRTYGPSMGVTLSDILARSQENPLIPLSEISQGQRQ